jgi:glycosyltransferase involved in cell wall biosynthesis
MSSQRILALTKYGRLGASSRLRTFQYLPSLKDARLDVTVQCMLEDDQLQGRYTRGSYDAGRVLHSYVKRVKVLLQRHSFGLLWIEKEALQWCPLWIERGLLSGVPYVLDYDDAVFHNYDMHRVPLVRRLYGQRLDGLMARASLVISGNEYLAQRARSAGASWVETLPTVIDLDRYSASPRPAPQTSELRVVWIGSPSTVKYLHGISRELQAVAHAVPFVLRVIGGGIVQIPGVRCESMKWSEASEVEQLQSADVGIMPLDDTPWERGKCGYKLIQYMACGLPVVGSAVGANNDIVVDRATGFLARDSAQWVGALSSLLLDKNLRQTMGVAGRKRVESSFCIQKTGPRLVNMLKTVGGFH